MKTNKEVLKNEEERKDRSRSSYSELPDDEAPSPLKSNKKDGKSNKDNKESRILRKSKSSKDKNDPDRFSGDGINFKAKIIGIDDVFDARGNRMCQDALQRLKAAVKLSGEHKQRILLNISLCGIRIIDEKSTDVLHHHPVHKISFISQDVGDSRAFGYVFGCPQTGHQFFGIKTEKTAAHVVCTLRDLFHTALELKKKEIEKAMELQNDTPDDEEHPSHVNGQKEIVDSPVNLIPEKTENGSVDDDEKIEEPIYSDVLSPTSIDEINKPAEQSTPIADNSVGDISAVDNLLDLQFEMDSLQQGISQMDYSIASAASLGFGVSFSEDDNSISSGNSFAMTPRKINRVSSLYHETMSISSRSSSTSDYNVYAQDNKPEDVDTLKNEVFNAQPSIAPPPQISETPAPNAVEDRYAVFYDIDSLPSVFDNPTFVQSSESLDDSLSTENSTCKLNENGDTLNSDSGNSSDDMKSSNPTVFAELDPLGNHPYVDKKNFFYEIKNPPKKVLKDLIGDSFEGGNSAFENESPSTVHLNDTCESTPQDKPCNPFVMVPPSPPKLPPKRSFSVASPYATNCEDTSSSTDDSAWGFKNPFNPFSASDEFPDIPPPNSPPPPPPPPRLPTKDEPSCSMSPPPRPPSRTSVTPTPPLPRRKVPLGSTSSTWFSFDQDALNTWPRTQLQPGLEDTVPPYSPPIPAPSRKLHIANKFDSPIHKSCSASNSPATSRRYQNHSPRSSSSSLREFSENCGVVNGTVSPSRKMLTRHSSIAQEPWTEKVNTENALPVAVQKNPFVEPVPTQTANVRDYTEAIRSLNHSPPLPPKSTGISRPRPSPSKKMLSVTSTISKSSSNSSTSDVRNESQSTSSLRFSSLEESGDGSCTEALCLNSTSSQPEEMFSSGFNGEESTENISTDSGDKQKLSPTSPDSIFRRKSDPFADDFFLSLPKKSVAEDGTSDSSSIVEAPCTNGFEADFENAEIPDYSHVNKLKNDVS